MIKISKSPSADSRSAKTPPTVEQLNISTKMHIEDVSKGLNFISQEIEKRGSLHDHTKIKNMQQFCDALNSGHIKDAINIPLDNISKIEYDKDTKIILYCASGIRSTEAAKKLSDLGYTNIYNLDGGLLNWGEALEE